MRVSKVISCSCSCTV